MYAETGSELLSVKPPSGGARVDASEQLLCCPLTSAPRTDAQVGNK